MDFCCGTTMTARLAPLQTDGGAQLTDVPFLYCLTCGHTVVAPAVEFDVTMYTHYCETDGVKQASLCDVVNREKIQAVLDEYTGQVDAAHPVATLEQIDHMLDVWNFAAQIGDTDWIEEVKNTLFLLRQVRLQTQQLQTQS